MVVHFAGPVRYHTEGLVEKNKVGLGHSMWVLGKKAESLHKVVPNWHPLSPESPKKKSRFTFLSPN